MRGIRQVASVLIPALSSVDVGVVKGTVGYAAAKVKRVDYFVPALSNGAQILQGSREENAHKVLELVAAKGGLN
jgi:electron transfer flavoprotein beta subunit